MGMIIICFLILFCLVAFILKRSKVPEMRLPLIFLLGAIVIAICFAVAFQMLPSLILK